MTSLEKLGMPFRIALINRRALIAIVGDVRQMGI
jgi:hypothetical protein